MCHQGLQSSPHVSAHYLLSQFHISRLFSPSHWHFAALYVCDKGKQGKKRNLSEENQNLHTSLKVAFGQFPPNLPHQGPSVHFFSHHAPYLCDRHTDPLSEWSLSPLLVVTLCPLRNTFKTTKLTCFTWS